MSATTTPVTAAASTRCSAVTTWLPVSAARSAACWRRSSASSAASPRATGSRPLTARCTRSTPPATVRWRASIWRPRSSASPMTRPQRVLAGHGQGSGLGFRRSRTAQINQALADRRHRGRRHRQGLLAGYRQGPRLRVRGRTSHGSVTGKLASPVVGIAADPFTGGYWVVTAKGKVYAFNAGSYKGKTLSKVTAIAADPAKQGYWLVTSTGKVYRVQRLRARLDAARQRPGQRHRHRWGPGVRRLLARHQRRDRGRLRRGRARLPYRAALIRPDRRNRLDALAGVWRLAPVLGQRQAPHRLRWRNPRSMSDRCRVLM